MSSGRPGRFELQEGDHKLTSAIVSDALDVVGLRHQAFRERLESAVPGSSVIGRARTIEFAVSDQFDVDDPYRDAISFIDGLDAGDMVVVACGGFAVSALWGELFSAAAFGAGCVGMVTDGDIRDTKKIFDLAFPAFSLGRNPSDYKGRMAVKSIDQQVRLCGVAVACGDLVVADDDGVVVVPAATEVAVLELARQRANTESAVLSELLAGRSLSEVWKRHRTL